MVSVVEELAACSAVIDRSVRISIDTRHVAVAIAAVAAGATIINDVSAGLYEVAADLGVVWVAMHMKGDPRTMQDEPVYKSVVAEVYDFLIERATMAVAAGVPEVWVDPGIGFGKTAQHNVDLLSNIGVLRELNRPVLIGHSRKRFLAKVLGRPVEERTFGTIGVAIAVAAQGADMIRVHDVRETRDALLAWHAIVNS